MRAMASILALAVWVAGSGSAGAHTCTNPIQVDVGQPATLTVGIASEGNTGVVGVDVLAPKGFKLDSTPVENKGWTIARTDGGSTLQFRGGRFPAGSCGFLLVRGTATSGGQKVMTLHTYDQDGAEREFASSEPFALFAGQVILAGINSSAPAKERSALTFLGYGLWVVAAGAVVAAVVRRRGRQRDTAAAAAGDERFPDRPRRTSRPR